MKDNWSQNQKILYNYDVSCLTLLNETGTLSTTKPSPLSRDEIVSVLELIAQTDPYKQQTIICHDYKFDEVILKAGTIVPITEDS